MYGAATCPPNPPLQLPRVRYSAAVVGQGFRMGRCQLWALSRSSRSELCGSHDLASEALTDMSRCESVGVRVNVGVAGTRVLAFEPWTTLSITLTQSGFAEFFHSGPPSLSLGHLSSLMSSSTYRTCISGALTLRLGHHNDLAQLHGYSALPEASPMPTPLGEDRASCRNVSSSTTR